MKVFKNIFVALFGISLVAGAYAADLTGVASVSVTSDTAAAAKEMAFDEARRQIILDVLGQYSIPDQLEEVLKNAKSAELMNLIATSSIDSEQQSNTTYSANIHMTIDRDAARNWLTEKEVQNWLTDGKSGDMFIVQAVMTDKLAGWIELNQIARDEGIELATRYINGNQVTIELPVSARNSFTIAIRENGWRYADQNGVLHIIK
ncbi:MAG TPA: hypothetical protein IAC63_00280 [Candidatus Enterousia avicola]|uniref:Uncharacterized protein n=1 Tax=Candidatus Enterousia avicola TaxID=2840787 RepID=A0A9D1MRC2_9PROT|nr:hypothetical protein [Candidatus Enterousia avicola]